MIHYAALKKTDVANGPGVRVSLFVSGCTHFCKGCFNYEAWDFNYGNLFDEAALQELLEALKPDYIDGLSVLGGEPLEPANQEAVRQILCRVREAYPEKSIWCYTGNRLEELFAWIDGGNETVRDILLNLDVLVDGEFVEEKKNLKLRFRGSENQRLLNARQSLAARQPVLARIPD